MIRTLAVAAAVTLSAGLATPALAGPGQCYDAYGRPVGPVYDTDRPNYRFLDSVVRRGGTCTGMTQRPQGPRYRDRGYYRYNQPYDGYRRYPYGYYNRDDGYNYSR